MASKTITFVTGNAKKLEEFVAIVGPKLASSFAANDIDLPEYQGEPTGVCLEKCKEAARFELHEIVSRKLHALKQFITRLHTIPKLCIRFIMRVKHSFLGSLVDLSLSKTRK
jgi:hypothetical protein